MIRVSHRLIYLLLAVVPCASLLSLDIGHHHPPVAAGPAASTCTHQCQHHTDERAGEQQQRTPTPSQPCHDDDCAICRYLAQFQVIQFCLTSELQAEHVEPIVPRVPVFTATTAVRSYQCRAPPCSVA